jgi:hypothetical protein
MVHQYIHKQKESTRTFIVCYDMSELGDVIRDCQRLHNSFFTNSRVEFIRRQANEVAHALARVATSLASFHIFIEIPTCIHHIIINEML